MIDKVYDGWWKKVMNAFGFVLWDFKVDPECIFSLSSNGCKSVTGSPEGD